MGTKVQGAVNIQGRYTFPPQIKSKNTEMRTHCPDAFKSHEENRSHQAFQGPMQRANPSSPPGQETRSHTLQLSPGVLRPGAARYTNI